MNQFIQHKRSLVSILFLLNFFCISSADDLVLPTREYFAELFPLSIEVADVDSDGNEDIVVANGVFSDSVSVLPGIGNGTFDCVSVTQIANSMSAVAVGDFNSDGNPDIAATSDIVNIVFVIEGDGTGQYDFNFEFFLPTGMGPVDVISADLNQDGIIDLATSNESSNSVSIFIGNGDGTFLPGIEHASGNSPSFIEAADINEDGSVDLVVVNGGNEISVLMGMGDGNFELPQPIDVGGESSDVAVADINNDTFLDLLVTRNSTGDVALLFGDGLGSFNGQTNVPVAAQPVSTITGDFNNDGEVDFVSVSNMFAANFATFMLGNGDGTFVFGSEEELENAPNNVSSGDFNSDGNLDIAISTNNAATVTVLLGSGESTFAQPLFNSFPAGNDPWSVASGDINNDGILDLVTANRVGNDISILMASEAGVFQSKKGNSVGNSPFDISLNDFNEDGILDLVTSNGGTDDISLLIGDGGGSFSNESIFGVGENPRSMIVGDFNGDNHLDVITANNESDDVSVLLGDGNGNFAPAMTFPTGLNPREIVASDFDGDSVLDLATANSLSNSISIFLGNGDGTFMPGTVIPAIDAFFVAAADVDNDNNIDLISDDRLILGNGDGTFESPVFIGGHLAVAINDYNCDGNVDLARLSSENVRISLGDGAGQFETTQDLDLFLPDALPSISAFRIISPDLNNDGLLDFVTANRFSDNVSVILNAGPPIVLGDVNRDGEVNLLDVSPFVTLIVESRFQKEADFNNDGVVNILDIQPIVDLITSG